MPIYEYECEHCRCRFEVKQGFDEVPEAVCPECQGVARRIFHAAPVIFKGSGFYITDSRKGNKAEPSADKPETASGEKEKGK